MISEIECGDCKAYKYCIEHQSRGYNPNKHSYACNYILGRISKIGYVDYLPWVIG